MLKRMKWTYEAELDYILPRENGKWTIGFLDKEDTPYEKICLKALRKSVLIWSLLLLVSFDDDREMANNEKEEHC